jgi:hypothetical protein
VLKASLNQVVTNLSGSTTLFNTVVDIIALIPGVDLTIGLIVGAGAILFNIVAGNTLSDYTSALANATLWSDIQCAIYNAISTDGYVTNGNFATVLANVTAVTYPSSDVKDAVVGYLTALGASGLEAVQNTGSLYVADCTACGVTGVALHLAKASNQIVQQANPIFPAGDFTLGGWIIKGSNTVDDTIYFGGYGSPNFSNQYSIYMDHTNGHPYAYFNHLGSAGIVNGSVDIRGSKHHLIVTRSGTTMALYIDGVLQGTAACSSAALYSTSGNSNWGGNPAVVPPSDQTLWNWAYYSHALTAAQAGAWAALGSFATPPAGYADFWAFNENTGTTVHDSVGASNGTATTGSTWTTHT